jgi:hypothetical protein
MTGSPRAIVTAVGGLVLLIQLPTAEAQSPSAQPAAVTRQAAVASGSIGGVVADDRGGPLAGVMVSALGAKAVIAVTDRSGRFELRTLSPGPYLIRAHISGYVSPRGQLIEVHSSVRAVSSIELRRASTVPPPVGVLEPASTLPILAAGIGQLSAPEANEGNRANAADAGAPPTERPAVQDDSTAASADDDHSETTWRLRHLRRGILKDVTMPDVVLADSRPQDSSFANVFTGVPFTGQFNLLTTGSFDTPRNLFTGDNFSRSIAYFSLAAPVGDQADWSMRGALTQGDISSWFIAGAYTTRAPARHRYDLGLSYSTQRYDGGNPAALRQVTDGTRNVGAVYGFDTFTLTPAVAVTYGARFSRYDYLSESGLLSPRVELTLSPVEHLRLNVLASSRALAPGAEEFLPPLGSGLWLPPQRTFSSIVDGKPLKHERTDHFAVEAERDLGATTISVRAFRQHVDDQLVTIFGVEPSASRSELGHYLVGNAGDVDATGWSAGFRTALMSRVHGSVEYSVTNALWSGTRDGAYLLVLAPAVVRPARDRVHDVSTAIETNVPETSTRILVVCRFSNGAPSGGSDRTNFDSRFDVQVHQSLPFMDFSTARWEMLLAVRNSFHESTSDSSVYDELLVVRPPKRVVGGLTLRF